MNSPYNFKRYSVLLLKCPDVECAAVLSSSGLRTASTLDKALPLKAICANQGFFDVFHTESLSGDFNAALSEPNTIILTDETARRFFLRRFLSMNSSRINSGMVCYCNPNSSSS